MLTLGVQTDTRHNTPLKLAGYIGTLRLVTGRGQRHAGLYTACDSVAHLFHCDLLLHIFENSEFISSGIYIFHLRFERPFIGNFYRKTANMPRTRKEGAGIMIGISSIAVQALPASVR